MVQHLALMSVAAPLLLLGAPVRLALAALPPRGATRIAAVLGSAPVRVLGHPVFGLGVLIGVLYGAHFSPLYERALENENVHAAEHGIFLTAALLYWMPIFAVAPAPYARSIRSGSSRCSSACRRRRFSGSRSTSRTGCSIRTTPRVRTPWQTR